MFVEDGIIKVLNVEKVFLDFKVFDVEILLKGMQSIYVVGID